MRRFTLALTALLLTGCVTSSYYLPTSGAEPAEGTSCGYPEGGGTIKFDKNASIWVAIYPSRDALRVQLQILLTGGAQLELLSPHVLLQLDDKTLELPLSSSYGDDLVFAARTPYRPYVIGAQAPPTNQQVIRLRLPPVKVHGSTHPGREVAFELRNKTGVVSCIQ